MSECTGRGSWLLLDPPSRDGYARRASLREKAAAPPAPFPSIDLILLSGAICDGGYAPVYLDAQIRRLTWQRLYREAPAIGASGMVSLLSSARMGEELPKLRRLKEVMGHVPTYVIASIHLAQDPQHCRAVLSEHPWLDGLVLNTAENNFSELITSRHAEPHNIAVRIGDEIRMTQIEVTYGEDLRIPRPVHAVFKNRRYFFPQTKRTPVTCVQLSFGCPFRCEFCLDNALYRKTLCRNVDDVVEEMAEIDRLGFSEVYFKDLTFGLNKRVTTELLDKLAARRLNLRWLCTTRVDVATPNLLRRMKDAGCYSIEFGVESGQRHRRAANGKPISDQQIRDVFDNCRQLGIETTAFIMIGFEDETEVEIRDTMRFVESLQPDYASYNIVNALAGTPLEWRGRKEGFLRTDHSDNSFATSNIKHKYLAPGQVEVLRGEAMRSFYCRPSKVFMRLTRLRSVFEFRKLCQLARFTVMDLAKSRHRTTARTSNADPSRKRKRRIGRPALALGARMNTGQSPG